MKLTTLLTTALLLLSAATDAIPQPAAADTTSLTLHPLPHAKRDPAVAPRRPAKGPKTPANRAKPNGRKPTAASKRKAAVTKNRAATRNKAATKKAGPAGLAKKKGTAAKKGGAAKSCPMPAKGKGKGKGGKLGKRAGDACAAPPAAEKGVKCSRCAGTKVKRGGGKKFQPLDLSPGNLDVLVQDTDCWQCGPGVKFGGVEVKSAVKEAIRLRPTPITYPRDGKTDQQWPHKYKNNEALLPPLEPLDEYLEFPLVASMGPVKHLYKGGSPAGYRVVFALQGGQDPMAVHLVGFFFLA
ncbi:uncharacterized protein H6S33_007948 [Morchella sextelata]|uniref:uncharacterized protein n=1 Tax=Morchella sextelata TaxID=1174677 RepID=UPI001D03662C|nr:uncharacterized protein H6S33_007948 [Morchella sextelata]KAH0602944.1 hypothetical protein H6S33_007948 [Morchella sextelata]